jgi:hypothetical protein
MIVLVTYIIYMRKEVLLRFICKIMNNVVFTETYLEARI